MNGAPGVARGADGPLRVLRTGRGLYHRPAPVLTESLRERLVPASQRKADYNRAFAPVFLKTWL